MIIRDLWTAKGPTLAELKILERLGRRRRALEAVTAADGDEATVITRALATLDEMEECLCEEGRAAPRLARGWEDLDQLEARLTALQAAAPARRPEGSASPQNDLTPSIQGVPMPVITAIETIRAVARRAAEDPSPRCFGGPAAPAQAARSLLPRVAELVKRLFAGNATGTAIRIVAQALAAFLPLLDREKQPDEPVAAPAEPELTTKDEARIDLLLQERAARTRQRGAGDSHVASVFARPDIPPAASAAEPAVTATPPAEAPPAEASPEADVWNDLLDLTSEALETFIRFRNAVGVKRCLELLDLLAEAFGVRPKEVKPAA